MEFLRVRFPDVQYSSSVHNLGVITVIPFSLSDHVNCIPCTCSYHLRHNYLHHSSLALPHAVVTLVHALIDIMVDFGNTVCSCLASLSLYKLQSIPNTAARLIGGVQQFAHISALIRDSLTLAFC